jgi:hypothetical protein
MRWADLVALMKERRGAYRVLVGKPDGKRPPERPRLRCEDNTEMERKEIGWEDVDWIDLAQDKDKWRVFVSTKIKLFFSNGSTAPRGPRPPHYRGFTITLIRHTTLGRTPLDE